MQRIYLDVPFEEKDQAREQGARWDKQAKRWYIFTDQDKSGFARWLSQSSPSPSEQGNRAPNGLDRWVNVRADSFYLASTHHTCFRCQLRTPIYGFVLPRSYESMALQLPAHLGDGQGINSVYSYPDLLDWLNTEMSRAWVSQGVEALPYNIYYLSDPIVAHMRQVAPSYRKVKQLWSNTCVHCRGVISDATKSDQPLLSPRSSTAAAYTELTPVGITFEAGARSLATGIEFVHRMAIRPV